MKTSAKGKEVFEREKIAKAANEKAVKERIEAAKKAREEATMRGKAAAKAWAEKNKQKAGTAKPTLGKENDKPTTVPEANAELTAVTTDNEVQVPEVAVGVTSTTILV